uniref:Exocyst complex component 8 n=1 Tax=Rhabditophanes sp. KR3021 TaxID=114890 RepID=A0AC35TYL8_9BILA
MSDDDIFTSETFNASEYISNQLKDVRIGQETKKLQQFRNKLQAIDDDSVDAIREIVFENYKEFIDTAKEISYLEREIYHMTSLMTDQKKHIENLMDSIGQDRLSNRSASTNNLNSNQNSIVQLILQKLDGAARILNNQGENSKILGHGEMTLINADSKKPIHSVMLVLLSDKLLVGYPSTGLGKYKYSLESTFPLASVAAVNVKSRNTEDLDETSKDLVFMLLIFPDQHYIKCDSARVKNEWLEKIDLAKKEKIQESNLQRQNTIRGKRSSGADFARNFVARKPSANPMLQSLRENELSEDRESQNEDSTEWLVEMLSELEMIIGSRDFDHAVERILEWKNENCKNEEINAQFKVLENRLVQSLSEDIKKCGPSGLQKIKKYISFLTSLDRGTYAIDLYLKRRSGILRANARELQVSEEPLSYVKKLCTLFITDIGNLAKEFEKQSEHFCLIIQWCSGELSLLLSLIRRSVIETAPTMAVLAHTWNILLSQCNILVNLGMDLEFEVQRLLGPALRSALESNFSNILESMRLRISEEKWKMYSLETETNLNRFLEEMTDLGLTIDWSCSRTHRSCINVTQNACNFARVATTLSRDLKLLDQSNLFSLTNSFMIALWTEYLNLLNTTNIPDSDIAREVHGSTCQFVISQVLPLCQQMYEDPDILTNLVSNNYFHLSRLLPTNEDQTEEESTDNDNLELSDSDDVVDI